MSRRRNRNYRAGVINLRGPLAQSAPPESERKPVPPEPPPQPQRKPGVPAPVGPPLIQLEAEPLAHNRNGTGTAKHRKPYGTSRYCGCTKPMVIKDRDVGRFVMAMEDRCLHCGKPRGATNAPVNHFGSPLPDEAA